MQTYLSMTPPESPLLPRLGASESSSSKKITHGEALRALLNTADKDRNNIVNSEMLMALVKKKTIIIKSYSQNSLAHNNNNNT